MLPVEFTKLCGGCPIHTLLESRLENLRSSLRADTGTASVAISVIAGQCLHHVPVVCLLRSYLEELLAAKVVVTTGDGLEVLVDAANDAVASFLHCAKDTEAIIPFEGRTQEGVILLQRPVLQMLQEHRLTVCSTSALVGRQNTLAPVLGVTQSQHHLVRLDSSGDVLQHFIEAPFAIPLESVECPDIIVPLDGLFRCSSRLIGKDVRIYKSSRHVNPFWVKANRRASEWKAPA